MSGRAVELPAPLTSFVGREQELASLVQRMGESGLVTLTGGPGSGKSRLAFEAARAVERVVRLVELAPLQRESAVLEAIVGDDAGGHDPTGAAATALDGSVLVLDNAEHVVEHTAEIVAALLSQAPALTILVTSCAADAQAADPEQVAATCTAVDRQATTLLAGTITSYTRTGFAWPRYTARLNAVRAALAG